MCIRDRYYPFEGGGGPTARSPGHSSHARDATACERYSATPRAETLIVEIATVISTDRLCKNSAMVRRAHHERFRGCYKFKYLAVHPERRRRINDTFHTVWTLETIQRCSFCLLYTSDAA